MPESGTGSARDQPPLVVNPRGDKRTLRIGWQGDPCDAEVDFILAGSGEAYHLEARHAFSGSSCIFPGVTHVIDLALGDPIDASSVTASWVDAP